MTRPNVSIDLGSDTTKVSYCYIKSDKKEFRIISDNKLFQDEAIPSKAYYDVENKTWLYGSTIEEGNEKPFETVVSIRFLLSLLEPNSKSTIFEYNKKSYNDYTFFPKFYFPEKKTVGNSRDFSEYVNNDMVFKANHTPKYICERFAKYIKDVVLAYIKTKRLNSDFTISLIYPPRCGKDYINEYKRIFQEAFGTSHPVTKVLSSTKAIAYYAQNEGLLNSGEDFLIFDIGEKDMSVTKGTFENDRIVIDATTNHNLPEEIGGADIDEEIYNYITGKLDKKESVGTTADSTTSNFQLESGLHSKLYLFLKGIKSAKELLSETDSNSLPEGAPISISLDTIIQTKLRHDKFLLHTKKTYEKMLSYVKEELKRANNKKVDKIFLCGGAIEAYNLYDYLDDNTKEKCLRLDRSTFAPALGANIVGVDDIQMYIRSAFTYGTFVYADERLVTGGTRKYRVFNKIIEKGQPLIENTSHSVPIRLSGSSDEEFLTLPYTTDEIKKDRRAAEFGFINGCLKIGEPTFSTSNPTIEQIEKRKRVCSVLGLKNFTGKNAEIRLLYGNKKIYSMYERYNTTKTYRISANEGFTIDSDGSGTPFLKLNLPATKGEYCYIKFSSSQYETKTLVEVSKITAEFYGIPGKIVIGNDNDE